MKHSFFSIASGSLAEIFNFDFAVAAAFVAFALWTIIAIFVAFLKPPKKGSGRLVFATIVNVIVTIAALLVTAAVVLEKYEFASVTSLIPSGALHDAVARIITIGSYEIYSYCLYALAALAFFNFVLTLARAKRRDYPTPVAPAEDDGYVLVDDGLEQPAAETEQIQANADGSEAVEIVEQAETEEVEIVAEPAETVEKEVAEPIEEEPVQEETNEEKAETEVVEEIAPETAEEVAPETAEETEERLEETEKEIEKSEPEVEHEKLARKRIRDVGSLLSRLDDIFDESEEAAETEPTKEQDTEVEQRKPIIERSEPIAMSATPEPIVEPEVKVEKVETKKVETEKGEAVEDVLARILGAGAPTVKAPEVKAAQKPIKKAKPIVREPKKEIEETKEIALEPETTDAEEAAPEREEIIAAPATEEKKVAAPEKSGQRRSRRVRTANRAAELFDEYLAEKSDEEKAKLTSAIDSIVVDED